MDAIRAVLARRSVRGGPDGGAISKDDLRLVVKCGLAAPSSKNAQPWRFHVISSSAILAELADVMAAADGFESFVPLNPETGTKRPDWESTVVESADALRSASAGIFIENLGTFSSGRGAVATTPGDVMDDALIGYSLEILGLGAAVQNMWIAATSLGLSGAFMGDVLVVEPHVKSRLGIEGDLVGVLTLSHVSPCTDNLRPRSLDVRDEAHVRWH